MKKLLLLCVLGMSMSASAQNALLKNATTGSVSANTMEDLCMVSNGTDVVLVAADMSSLWALDIADNDASKATANTITSIPNFITDKLNPLAGQTVTVLDIEVNPISKSVYVLGRGGANKYIFKVENGGANVSIVDLSNIAHSQLPWGAGFSVNDMAYGNGTLYVSSGSFSLDGQLGWVAPPFEHNGTITTRNTTLFKSNWGGNYFTTAPLETLTFGDVDGKGRLMGVTTCAPGFSIDVANLAGSGVLTVTEDFNIHQGQSTKAVFMQHDGKDWLFDLHDSKLYRIGKKYLDGSQVTANKYDNNATMLRDNAGNVVASLPADEIKEMSTGNFGMIAYWDNYRLLLLKTTGDNALELSQMSTETPPPTSVNNITTRTDISIYPNPANDVLHISLKNGQQATVNIVSINGSLALSQQVNGRATIDISSLTAGVYTATINTKDGAKHTQKLTIK